ncbi:hypothetical protein J6590_093593 [Homalodisca vitripennis]|nr:hypothetical protein J6590_093593 [Homalodisca vitripennis]
MALIRIKLQDRCLYIAGIYRNQGNLEESLEIISQCIQVVPIWRCPIIVMGDINIDCLNVNRDNMLLEDIMRSCEDETITVEVLDEGISDHTAQLCMLHHQQVKPTAQMTEKRQFSERNMRDIKIKLQQESWEDLITAIDADTAYNLFSNTLGMIINSACPLKKSRVKGKRRNKITDAEAERLHKVFLQAQIVYNTTGQLIHKQDTASKKKAYDLRLKELRRKEVTDKILHAENKSKALWAVVNNERKTKISHSPKELMDPVLGKITDSTQIADYLNSRFVTAADKALEANPKPPLLVPAQNNVPPLTLFPTTFRRSNKDHIFFKNKMFLWN